MPNTSGNTYEEAMDQGFIRRPERKQSARQFLNVALPDMEEAISSNDPKNFFLHLLLSLQVAIHAMQWKK
jgi:hypothetical protein